MASTANSDEMDKLSNGYVLKAGGHAQLSSQLGGQTYQHRAFGFTVRDNGTLKTGWQSISVNHKNFDDIYGTGGLVPEQMRAEVMDW